MTFVEIFTAFLVALAAGALIGMERQQSKALEKKPSIGGVRTFPLIAVTGCLAALVARAAGPWAIGAGLLALGGLLAVSHFLDRSQDVSDGITTEVAALLTFLLGVVALLPEPLTEPTQRYLLIVSVAGVTMALLSFKEPLHEAVERLSNDDIYATAKFVILALVGLPLLPNRTYGPLDVINPYNIGLMVVLIAGISFVGYALARFTEASKGLLLTGVVGGLASSTAVTLSMGARAREVPSAAGYAAAAAVVASSTMFARVLVIVAAMDLGLLQALAWPVGAMALAGYGAAALLYRRSQAQRPKDKPLELRNPFELGSALKFGLLYAAVIFLAKAAQVYLGNRGLYVTSILAGSTDVDAITLSVAKFHRDGLAVATAATAITVAAISNTLVKIGIAAWSGGWQMGIQVGAGLGAALLVGGLVLLFT